MVASRQRIRQQQYQTFSQPGNQRDANKSVVSKYGFSIHPIVLFLRRSIRKLKPDSLLQVSLKIEMNKALS